MKKWHIHITSRMGEYMYICRVYLDPLKIIKKNNIAIVATKNRFLIKTLDKMKNYHIFL